MQNIFQCSFHRSELKFVILNSYEHFRRIEPDPQLNPVKSFRTHCYFYCSIYYQILPFRISGVQPTWGECVLGAQIFNQIDNNRSILTISKMIENVITSPSEAECEALFINAWEARVVQTTLEEMWRSQPSTTMQVDKSTCDGIMNRKIQQKCSKVMEMWVYWARDRVKQKHFGVFWKTWCDQPRVLFH